MKFDVVNDKNSKVSLCQGDITKINIDAETLNAANETVISGEGVDWTIHEAAGPGLLHECQILNGCKTDD